jgi:hypothetical protein
MYARLVAAGLLLAALVGAWWYVDGLRTDLATYRDAKVELQGRLDEQSRMVARWSESQRQAIQRADQALKAARDDTRAQQGAVDALQARILASAGVTCGQAIAEIREQLR